MDFSLLKQKNFLLLMLGKLASLLGTKIQSFALSLYVLNNTESTALFAMILVFSMLPHIVLGPFVGVLADWYDRKKIIVRLDLVSGVISLIYAILFFSLNYLDIWMIILFVVLQSLISLLFNPTINAVLPSVVKEKELVDAKSIDSVISDGAKLAGPAIAALILTFSNIGFVLIINSISFILSAISEMFITLPSNKNKLKKFSFNEYKENFVEGLSLITGNKIIKKLVLIVCIVNFVLVPIFTVGMPHVLKKILEVSDFSFGIYETIFVLPLIVAPFFVKKFTGANLLKSLINIYLMSGVLISVISLTVYLNSNTLIGDNIHFLVLLLLTFVIGFIVTIGNILHSSYFYSVVPNEALGRVGSVFFTVAASSVPLGQALLGLALDYMNASLGILIMASLCIFTMIYFKISFKGLEDQVEESNSSLKVT